MEAARPRKKQKKRAALRTRSGNATADVGTSRATSGDVVTGCLNAAEDERLDEVERENKEQGTAGEDSDDHESPRELVTVSQAGAGIAEGKSVGKELKVDETDVAEELSLTENVDLRDTDFEIVGFSQQETEEPANAGGDSNETTESREMHETETHNFPMSDVGPVEKSLDPEETSVTAEVDTEITALIVEVPQNQEVAPEVVAVPLEVGDHQVLESQHEVENPLIAVETDLVAFDEVEELVFTEQQLDALYENPELKGNEEFVGNFLKTCNQERHEFYELLIDYYKARLALVDADKNSKDLWSEYERQKENVWQTEEFVTSASGKCADGSKVKHAHNYKQVKFDADAAIVVNKVLQEMRHSLHEVQCMKSYTCQLAKQHIDLYIYDLLTNIPFLKDLDVNSPVTAWPSHLMPSIAKGQLQQLQQCISVLFMFHRRRLADEEFVTQIRNWTVQLVSCLLRVATVSDHLFLLNHLLRCPPGVGQWGAALLQILPPTLSGPIHQQWCWSFEHAEELPSEVARCLLPPCMESATSDVSYENMHLDNSWGGHLLDHFLAMLAMLLQPVTQREEMLGDLAVTLTPSPDGRNQPWTFLDEDGEEDDEPSESSLLLKEKDYIDFFNQFPMSSLFQYVLGIQSVDSGLDYSVERMTSYRLMRLFAFNTCVMKVLSAAFSTLQQLCYKRFVKIIGRSICQTVQYMSDHWLAYRSWRVDLLSESEDQVPLTVGSEPAFSLRRLQHELDELCHRAVVCILEAHFLGAWQFLADMPYHSLSRQMLWKLFWMLIDLPSDGGVGGIAVEHDWRMRLNDPQRRDSFISKLMLMSFSEGTFLLTTFANMARCQPEETEFVEAVCLELYEISQMHPTVREFYGKTGRDLLGSIAASCPCIISTLLARVSLTIDETGMEAVYLFKALPLQKWVPIDADMLIIRTFLLRHPISSCQHHLARSVLAGLNWGLSGSDGCGELALPISLHQTVAIYLVEVELAVDLGAVRKLAGGDILAQWNVYKSGGEDIKKIVNAWLWTVALSLRLHQANRPVPVMRPTSEASDREDQSEARQSAQIPDINDTLEFLPVKQALPQSALACFIALSATSIGHELEVFCSTGLQLLAQLVESKHWLAALKVLSNSVTTLMADADTLLQEQKFVSVVHSLALADLNMAGFLQKLTGRVGAGANTKLLASLVQTQVLSSLRPDRQSGSRQTVKFWTEAFTSLDNWSKEKSIQCVLDSLVKTVFHMPACLDALLGVLYKKYEELLTVETKGKAGIMASLFSVLSSSGEPPSLLNFAVARECPWYAFAALSVESQYEKNCGLRDFLHADLEDNPNRSVEQSLKQYLASHSFPTGLFQAGHLCIYRWYQLAEKLDIVHPVMPIVWQHFFALFFYFRKSGDGSSSRSSQGQRFYSKLSQSRTVRMMKHRLLSLCEHHKEYVAMATAYQQAQEEPVNLHISLSQELAGLYYAMSLWLEEPRLHSSSLYLPDLPPQYLYLKLEALMKPELVLWYDLVDQATVTSDVQHMVEVWLKATRSEMEQRHVQQERQSTSGNEDTAAGRLISRLRRTESSPKPAPTVALPPPPLERVDFALVTNPDTIVSAVHADLTMVVNYARKFSDCISTITGLDFEFLESLPNVYYNEDCTIDLNVPCRSRFNPNHTCSGPARLVVRFKERRVRAAVERRVQRNREDWLQAFRELSRPVDRDVVVSVIRIESAITVMAKAVVERIEWRDCIMESASVLFYHMVRLVNESVTSTPPVHQFFSFCIDVLGQRFIASNPAKTKELLFTMINSPELSSLLCPIFTPNSAAGDFVNMYDRVAETFSSSTSLSFSLLSKFDIHDWLNQSSPSYSECKHMIDCIGRALAVCGKEPSSDTAMVFGLYRAHLRHFLCHKFPTHYGDILQMLLKYTSQSLISPLCWEDFHALIGCPISLEEGQSPETLVVMSDHHSAAVLQLSPGQVTETVEWLGSHFHELRNSFKPSVVRQSNGCLLPASELYSCLHPYITLLANLLGYMGQLEIVHAVGSVVNQSKSELISAVQTIWQLTVKLFDPWIQMLPVTLLDGSTGIQPPWSEGDVSIASKVVCQFVSCVSCLQSNCQALVFTEHDVMLLVWQYYQSVLTQPLVPSQVLTVFHIQLRKLSWQSFFPTTDVLRNMLEFESVPSCYVFLSKVIPNMNWMAVMRKFELEVAASIPEAPCLFHCTILQLIVKMLVKKEIVETQDCSLKSLLPVLHNFHWYHVDARAFSSICLWQQEHSNPLMVFCDSSWLAISLRLLRQAAEFHPLDEAPVGSDALPKRCRYIQLVVTMVSRCTSQKDLSRDVFFVPVKALFDTIEMCVVKDGRIPSQDIAMMLSEFLSLLNHCRPRSLGITAILSTILKCIRSPSSSSRSVLSLPFIAASCHSLASMSHMAAVLETAITTHFKGLSSTASQISRLWSEVLTMLEIPELSLDEFLQACVSARSLLTLYAHALKYLPQCNNLKQEFDILSQIVQWCSDIQLTVDSEAKILLLWHKAVDLSTRHIDFGGSQSDVIAVLKRLAAGMIKFGEDKQSSGFLGAIGLGKRSRLSTRFRLLSRSISAAVSIQLSSDLSIRLHPNDPGHPRDTKVSSVPSPQTEKALSSLESLRSNRQYADLTSQVDEVCSTLSRPSFCLRDVPELLSSLANTLFPTSLYLRVLPM